MAPTMASWDTHGAFFLPAKGTKDVILEAYNRRSNWCVETCHHNLIPQWWCSWDGGLKHTNHAIAWHMTTHCKPLWQMQPCNTLLDHIATCNSLQHMLCVWLQHVTTIWSIKASVVDMHVYNQTHCCNTLQHATHCNTCGVCLHSSCCVEVGVCVCC